MPTPTPQEEPKVTIRSAMKSGLSGMLAPAELLCYAVAFIVGTVIKAIRLGFYDGSQK